MVHRAQLKVCIIPIGTILPWCTRGLTGSFIGLPWCWQAIASWRTVHTEILLNQTEIRLYLLSSDWFGTKLRSVRFQINLKMINTIWFQFELIRFWKDLSVCMGGCVYYIFFFLVVFSRQKWEIFQF